MNVDTKSTVVNAMYSSKEKSAQATSTQIKRFTDANTSFASEMSAATNKQAEENVSSAKETTANEASEQVAKSEKKDEKKLEQKTTEKTSKEQVPEENSSENNEVAQNNSQPQNGAQGDSQNSSQGSYTPLSDQIQAYMNANGVDLNFASINSMQATSRSQLSGMVTTVDYSSVKMSDTDAKFFADLVSNTDMSMTSIAGEFEKAMQNGNVKMVQSTAKATAALIEALKESSKTNQPFRIDFDKDISVVLQVDKSGKINANFIPGDKAVENYLRNNIEFLRQRFTEEEISYGDLSYSQSRKNRDDKQKRNDKENGHE